MISEKMQDALNKQINEEMYSSYLYQQMSAHFDTSGLKGMSRWMALQAREEWEHAMKIYHYVLEQRRQVKLLAIKAPPDKMGSPLDVFQAAMNHEQHITGCINDLVNQAAGEKDHATVGFLQWFVKEQVEEEANADEVVHKLKMVGGSHDGLLMLDRELGKRGKE